MNINDALNLLSLKSPASQDQIKKAFKIASLEYHPDRNPAGNQMMVAINSAYLLLKKSGTTVNGSNDFTENNYAEELNELLKKLLLLDGLIIEICGNWVWFQSPKKHKDLLGKNGLKCKWSAKKKLWYYRPSEYKSSSRKNTSMNKIRETYGSTTTFKTNPDPQALSG